MKKNVAIFVLMFFWPLVVFCQDKPKSNETPSPEKSIEIKVDPLLDPFYFVTNLDEIVKKRTSFLRKRKGDVPEQLWKVKTAGTVTCQPLIYNKKLILGTSIGRYYYLNPKTGVAEDKAADTNVPLGYIGMRNDQKFVGVSWIGTLTSFAIKWENFIVSSNAAYKAAEKKPLGGLAWMNGIIVTRRDDYPIFVEMTKGTAVSSFSSPWSYGQATTPIIFTNDAFWLGTSKGQLLAIDEKISQVISIIQLKKSFATALAFDDVHLFILTADCELFSFDRKTGIQQWQIKLESTGVDSMICDDGQIFVNAGSFYAINGKNGSILCERSSRANEKFKRTKPIVTNKRIYTCDSNGTIFIFNRQDFKLLQSINLEEDVMVNFIYEDNVIYIPTIMGNFYAIDVSLY